MCGREKERKKAGAEREVKAAAERESGAGRWVNHGWTRMNTETNAAKQEGRKKVGGQTGSFVLTSFFPEKEKAGGGTGVEALLDLRQGEVREVIREEGEEGAAHEGEIGEGVRVARARAVLAPDGVAAPVVADFDAGPVALDEREPLGRSVRGRLGAGEVIADFVGGDGGALHRAGAAHDDHGAGVGEVGGERFEREGVDASGDDAAVAGIGEEKKGVEVWALSASACASSLGWLPLIWSR